MDNKILNSIFDNEMCESIMNFAQTITNSYADIYIVMSRKAACFIRFLERHGYISFNGELVTDRILDIDIDHFKDKDIIIIDDVVVSGTTIYSIVQKLNKAYAKSISVYVLGVNENFYNPQLFTYTDENGNIKNYLQSPYIKVTDAACMRVCSNIVSTFALDISPYDVDFPRHKFATIAKKRFEQIISCSDWLSYDVSSDLQSQNEVKNITLLPTEHMCKIFDNILGVPISKLGYFKIRIFAKHNKKKEQYVVNAVPYFLFNEITSNDINAIFDEWFSNDMDKSISEIAKVRILQYVLAEKLFILWNTSVNNMFSKKQVWTIDKSAFNLIFPKEYYPKVLKVINSGQLLKCNLNTLDAIPNFDCSDNDFQSQISINKQQEDNRAVLQTKLIEPFTNLYFTKEKISRQLVLAHSNKAFDIPEYKSIIERLKHGYSYRMLINILKDFPDIYDKVTTVSLFIDEAIDAGIIVPIIAQEFDNDVGTFYFRAYRHGEDVPFGELQEKLCSILLTNYEKEGGKKILSKLRVEKLLVLFIKIGMKQGIFKPSPQDSIYYNVNVDSYLQGNITTVQDTTSKRSYHYLRHRTDARWLSEVLCDKGIICLDNNNIDHIEDNIDIDIDQSTKAKVSAIGKTFAKLYKNSTSKNIPYVNDKDLILFSTCLFPHDVVNALAAELAIFLDRWNSRKKTIKNSLESNSTKFIEQIQKGDIYTSINSGQRKFFDFIAQKAQSRIDEISQQLNDNDELSIYGTHWDQFWPDNRNWDFNSIEKEMLNTIISEGKYLVFLNMLCRMLFFCTTAPVDSVKREVLKKQIQEYQQKLKHDIFSKFEEASELIDFSNELITKKESIVDYNLAFKIYLCISKYVSHIPSLLSDVELLLDRHGKPCKINRYVHAIYLKTNRSNYPDVGDYLSSYFGSQSIEHQVFPIGHPSSIFPESGIWIFVKGGMISDMIRFVQKLKTHLDILDVSSIKIYYNLSENLRLKIASNCNTRKNFGSFSSYASRFSSIGETNYQYLLPIYWIIEKSEHNIKFIEELENEREKTIKVLDRRNIDFETSMSSSSCVFTTQLISTLEKYRKEYKKMNKKCQVFISYSEDSAEHISRVKLIVERLREEDFDVLFFEDAPLGTDIPKFMRKLEECDIAIVIGTDKYKDRAYNINYSGVSFEDRILCDIYMSDQREKIIPLSFGNFGDSFPAPFNTLKGMSLTIPTKKELDMLVSGLINRYKLNNPKS